MGYDFTGGRISHFPIDFRMGLTTVQRKGAACDKKKPFAPDMRFLGAKLVKTVHVYKVNGVGFRFDIITSFFDVIPQGPRHTRTGCSLDLSLFYIELCYCRHLPYGLIFEII